MSTKNEQTKIKMTPAFVGGLAAGVIVGSLAGAFLPDRAIGAGVYGLHAGETSAAQVAHAPEAPPKSPSHAGADVK